MIGLIVFGVASLLGGLATNEGLLLAARGLQGLGAALASPAALALIATTFPAGPQRNRAFAVYAAMSGAGAAVGLILGGWLTGLDSIFGLDIEGWRLTLLINIPIGIAAALLAPRFLRESESHTRPARPPGRHHRHPRPARPGLRLQPRRQRRLGRHPDPRRAWSAGAVVLAAVPRHREPGRAPAAAVAGLPQPHPGGQLRGDVPGAGRDVRDVLLPEPVHPEHHGLQPARGRRRVPAVLLRPRGRGRSRLQPDQPDSTRATWRASARCSRPRACSCSRGCRSTPRSR